MNPSNAGNRSSGFSSTNEKKSDFNFETPSVSRSGSGLRRPRFVKRKGLSSQNLRSAEIPRTQVDLGYNTFRPILESSVPGLSGFEKGSSGHGEFGFGKSNNDAFVFGANKSGGIEKGVVEELKNLKIGSEFVPAIDYVFGSSSNAGESSISGKGGNKHSEINDESIMSKLPEDMKKLDIGGPGNGEHPEKIKDGNFNLSSNNQHCMNIDMKLPEDMRKLNIEDPGNEKQDEKVASGRFNVSGNESMRFGFGSTDNVGGLDGKDMEFELQNELNKKLNIKDAGKVESGSVRYSADDMKKVEFVSSRKGVDSLAGSFPSTLSDKIKNLSLKDSLTTSDKENPPSQSTKSNGSDFDGRKETPLSTNMEEQKGGRAGDTLQSDVGTASSNTFAKDMPTGYFGNMLFHNVDKPVHSEFVFQTRMQGKNVSGSQVSLDQPKNDVNLSGGVTASSSSSFSSSRNHARTTMDNFEVPVMNRPQKKDEFIQECFGTPSFEFKTKVTTNLFSGVNENLEFNAKRESIRDAGMKKKRGKSKGPTKVQLWLGQDFLSRESSSHEIPEASDSYSPMDVSPYRETLADNPHSRENSVTSDESFSVDNSMGTDSVPKVSDDAIDEDLAMATSGMDINEGNATCQETKEEHFDNNLSAEGTLDDSVSGAETESFKSATEEVDFISDNTGIEIEASSSSNIEGYDTDGRTKFGFPSSSEGLAGSNFTFSASSAAQGQSPTSKRLQKKKNWLKSSHDINNITPNTKISYASSSSQFIPFSGASLLLSPGQGQKGDPSNMHHKSRDSSEVDRAQAVNQESDSTSAAMVAAQEACEKWRVRLESNLKRPSFVGNRT